MGRRVHSPMGGFSSSLPPLPHNRCGFRGGLHCDGEGRGEGVGSVPPMGECTRGDPDFDPPSFSEIRSMFTGLVEGLGSVVSLTPDALALTLQIAAPADLPEWEKVRLGDSIALNGCCLTVVAIAGRTWSFQAGSETLSRTNLGQLQVGDVVNIERSLQVGARLGGHFVQGHVDALGSVVAIDQEGEWVHMTFRVPPTLTRQMVEKGSITVDGVSLTLVSVTPDQFRIALIPHTLQVTTLGRRALGDAVNIETDILGKYIEKMLPQDSPFESRRGPN